MGAMEKVAPELLLHLALQMQLQTYVYIYIYIYIFFRDFSLGEADFVPWVSFGHSGRSFSLAIRGILEPSMAVAVARSESVHNQFPRQWDKARPLYGGGGPANCTLAIPAFEKGI